MSGRERPARSGLLSAVIALVSGACGSVGDPLPPLLNLPRPVGDLEVRQVADEIEAAWTWPALTTEGTVARQVGGFTLWAVDVPDFSRELAPETIDAYRVPVADLDRAQIQGKGPGDRLVVRTPLADWRAGQPTVLAVTARNRAGRDAGYSNQARLEPLQPPAAPLGVGATVQRNGVALAWQPAARAEEYAVERASGTAGEFAALGRLGVPSFLDRTVDWSEDYRYRLRPYRQSRAGWIEGPPSVAVEVSPRDTFAPTPPAGLRAVRTPVSVELSWLPSPDPDTEGYRVLRDGEDVSGLIRATAFSDATAVPERSYLYAVAARDGSGNESEQGEPLEVPASPAAAN